MYILEPFIQDLSKLTVKTCAPLSSSNPNLYAQKGLFTYPFNTDLINAPKEEALPFDQLIADVTKGAPNRDKLPVMYHFTLPQSAAGEVLWLLAKEGINAARLFPGFDGVARHMKLKPYFSPTS